MFKHFTIFTLITLITSCAHHTHENQIEILSVDDVNWEKLNPARGDKSPKAGTLWGDRKGSSATGFLAKFVDGFSSPPHIHNVSYRAIVIEGLVHNDDPKAANMWMPKGSYWTQPVGESHITSAKGKSNIALVEIDKGPYLVRPANQAFDSGERPYNIHASNIIWREKDNYKITDLWKNKKEIVTGSMIKFDNKIRLDLSQDKLIIVSGKILVSKKSLKPGSLIAVKEQTNVSFSCETEDCILYLKSE